MQTILIVFEKVQLILQHQIVNMGGKSFLLKRLYLTVARNKIDVKIARYHNIFGPEGLGIMEEKKHQLLYVERLHLLKIMEEIRFGEMEYKQGLFYMLMNA